jgi:hypothetical protein
MRRGLWAVLVAGCLSAFEWVALAGEVAPAPQPGAEEAAPPPAAKTPLCKYLTARGNDFLDIFNLKLSLSDDMSFLVNVRGTRFAQIGFGRFSGTKIGFQGPSAGIYGEGRTEVGISVVYLAWIGRKTSPRGINEDAQKTNRFFGRADDIKGGPYREYYDAGRPWHTVGATIALPFLPGIEAEINPAEAVDFLLSFFDVRGLRIPPPFYKVDSVPKGERIPAPDSIRWHGQQEFEQYE